MNDRGHPNHPDNDQQQQRHDPKTGEIDDEAIDGEILDPISTGALATLQRVEIDQQVATAKAYPRNVVRIKQELTALVTMDEDTADDCIYALPRGNKHIKGPSARFADALISFWGNARSGAFITQVNRDDKFVEAIGSFQDVERNVIRQRRVRRPIVDRYGKIYNADMINMTGNAACVIAERNAILNGIPKPLWGPAYEQAFALVAGTTKTLGEKLARAEKAFALHNISMDMVLEKLGYADTSKIVPDDIVTLRGMLTALKSGEETLETIFGRGAAGHAHEVVKNPLQDKEPTDDFANGAAGAKAKADTVIEADSRVTKMRDGKFGPPILDLRFKQGDQWFETLREWTRATKEMPDLKFPAETASNGGAKSDTTAAGGTEAPDSAGGASDAPAPADAKGAQAASVGPGKGKETLPGRAVDAKGAGPYTDGKSYLAWLDAALADAKTKAAVTDLYGSTRTDRMELCSSEQIEDANEKKAAALAKLKGDK